MLAKIAPRFGFTLDTVSMRPGEKWVREEDMIARWGDDVGVALLTFVTSTASHRSDIAGLVAHGHRMGSLVGADITQGIGVAPFSVGGTQTDFVVSTSLKWLCGTSGAGILQVRPALLVECEPELRGWFVRRIHSRGILTGLPTHPTRAVLIMERLRYFIGCIAAGAGMGGRDRCRCHWCPEFCLDEPHHRAVTGKWLGGRVRPWMKASAVAASCFHCLRIATRLPSFRHCANRNSIAMPEDRLCVFRPAA